MSTPILALSGIRRRFQQGGTVLDILSGVDLDVAPGELVGLVGPSGAGKSTLLHIAGLLERPSDGEVLIRGNGCAALADGARTALRRQHIGFVYQFHHLLPDFTALENVMMPQLLAESGRRLARGVASELLERLGLAHRLHHRPARLSGGEQQRVAIARALANSPDIVLADEPTGNLDPQTADQVFDLLLHLVRERGMSAVVATHNPVLAARTDRTLVLTSGRLRPFDARTAAARV